MKARFTSFPQPATLSDYRRASDELESRLAELPGLVAIYRFGSVSAPGISDLDRVAVVEERMTGRIPSVWPRLAPATRRLAMHTPFLADPDTFRHRRWFAHLDKLELVCGESIGAEDPPDPAGADVLLAVEGLVTNLLRRIRQTITGRIKVRAALCELASIRYGLQLAGITHLEAPDTWELTTEVVNLREAWFKGPDHLTGLSSILVRAPGALRQALAAIETTGGRPSGAVQLHGSWSNVQLVASTSRPTRSVGAKLPLSGLVGHSRRLGEMRWRARARLVPVPAPVLTLLAGALADQQAFRARRFELVQRYHARMAATRKGYSTLGFAITVPPE